MCGPKLGRGRWHHQLAEKQGMGLVLPFYPEYVPAQPMQSSFHTTFVLSPYYQLLGQPSSQCSRFTSKLMFSYPEASLKHLSCFSCPRLFSPSNDANGAKIIWRLHLIQIAPPLKRQPASQLTRGFSSLVPLCLWFWPNGLTQRCVFPALDLCVVLLYQFAMATNTKYHKLSGLNNRNLFFFRS